MKTILFVIFLILVSYLIVSFIKGVMLKGTPKKDSSSSDIYSIIIPAIIASLVAHGLIQKQQTKELEGSTFEELEEYLIEHGVFDSSEEMKDWVLHQPDLVGYADSLFGGLDVTDLEQS